MGLSEKRSLFFKIRQSCRILVRNHAFRDYPERGFSQAEIVNLVRSKVGHFAVNNSDVAIEGSFLFNVMDDLDRKCKLVILIEESEVVDAKTGISRKETIIVCSAYREVKDVKS